MHTLMGKKEAVDDQIIKTTCRKPKVYEMHLPHPRLSVPGHALQIYIPAAGLPALETLADGRLR